MPHPDGVPAQAIEVACRVITDHQVAGASKKHVSAVIRGPLTVNGKCVNSFPSEAFLPAAK
jgi:hypothetical protein